MIIIEPKDRPDYRKALVKELAELGIHNAMREVCQNFFDSKDYSNSKQVIAYLEELAGLEDKRAMLLLGCIYYTGKGVEQSYKKAVKWYERAADMLESYGLCNLGYCYYYGRDIEINYERAYKCFAQSAFMGNANAMYKLGDMFFYGNHVEENKEAAFYWYTEAFKAGRKDEEVRANIHYRLGKCYSHGYGTSTDYMRALVHLQDAEYDFFRQLENGDEFAALTLPKVREELDNVRGILYIESLLQ